MITKHRVIFICRTYWFGKTEIAKVLSRVLNIDLLRFDMSEYMERHSISRLIGSHQDM